jgi:hypothetical protein
MADTRLTFWRSHYAVAVVVVILIAFGVKLVFFSTPMGDADPHAGENASMNVFQMHIDHPKMKSLPIEDVKDPI